MHKLNKADPLTTGTELDHIGIAVSNLDKAAELYQLLGLGSTVRETVLDQGVELLMFPAGQTRLELLCPLNEDTPIGRFIMRNGEGLHHIALRVNDIQSSLRDCAEAGYRLIDKKPRIGAGGNLVAFLHPRSTGGVLIELMQLAE